MEIPSLILSDAAHDLPAAVRMTDKPWVRAAWLVPAVALAVSACSTSSPPPENTALPSVSRPETASSNENPVPTNPISVATAGPSDIPSSTSIDTSTPSSLPTTTAANSCHADYLTAGSRFKPSNADDMQKQLDVLNLAEAPDPKTVTVDNLVNAGSLLVNSADPEYVQAIDYELQHPAATAQELLQMADSFDTALGCAQQLAQIKRFGGILIAGLGPQTNRELSFGAKTAWDQLRAAFSGVVRRAEGH